MCNYDPNANGIANYELACAIARDPDHEHCEAVRAFFRGQHHEEVRDDE